MTAPANRPHPPLGTASAYGLFAFCLPVWGINWPVLKIALGSMPPNWLNCARMGLCALCLFAALGVLGRLRLPGREDLPTLLSVGVMMMGIFPAMIVMGLEFAEAGRASLLSFIAPLWVTPAAILLFGERLTRLKAVGLALGIGGLGVLFNPIGFDWSKGDVVYGNLMLLGSSMVWAVTILHMRHHVWRSSPFQLAPWNMLAATLVAALLGIVVDSGEPEPGGVDRNAVRRNRLDERFRGRVDRGQQHADAGAPTVHSKLLVRGRFPDPRISPGPRQVTAPRRPPRRRARPRSGRVPQGW